MKKTIALILTLALALCCAVALAEETETRTPDGQFIFHNASGLLVTKITLINNSNTENVLEITPGGGLKPDDISGEVGLFLNEGEDGSMGLMLMIDFEDGQISIYDKLDYEKAMIEILPPVDPESADTPIDIVHERQMGFYWIINATGGTVKDVTIAHNETGEYSKADEIPADGEVGIGYTIPDGYDTEHCLTISFTLEDGTVQKYENLSIERATITLLAPDAVSGATPIAFSPFIEK